MQGLDKSGILAGAIPSPQSTGVRMFKKREENCLEIKEQAPMLYIVKVMNDSLGEVGIAAQTIYLCPSCDSRLQRMSSVVLWDLVLKATDQFRALGTRTNQAHLTLEHIPELRHLIYVPSPHVCTDSQSAGIVFG